MLHDGEAACEQQAGKFFTDEGLPTNAAGWDEIDVSTPDEEKPFALEVTGDAMEPLYRDGNLLILSPTASIRKGDRVVVSTKLGEVIAMEVRRQSAKAIDLVSLDSSQEDRVIPVEEVAWVARIIWARQ